MTRYHADQDTELVVFAAVQEAKRLALAVLDEEERVTIPGRGSEGPTTWEDTLREIAQNERTDRFAAARLALAEWEHARNEAWTYLIRQGVPEYLTKLFRGNYPVFNWISAEDVEAEVIFRLPHFIERYIPGSSANFGTYCARAIQRHLREWASQQGPVEVPRDDARQYRPDVGRVSYDALMADLEDGGDDAEEAV
jgi:hypothetical protein